MRVRIKNDVTSKERNGQTAKFVDAAINTSGKYLRTIAKEAGYLKPSTISQIRSGVERVSMNKIPALANAIEVDPYDLLSVAMSEYLPEVWEIIQEVLNGRRSKTEQRILDIINSAGGGMLFAPETPQEVGELRKLVIGWKENRERELANVVRPGRRRRSPDDD